MTETEIKAVEIRAELRKISTMVDGTVNVLLNLPEDCLPQVKVLLDWRGLELRAVITCYQDKTDDNDFFEGIDDFAIERWSELTGQEPVLVE